MLVHGSWHGAWCWRQVAALLRRKGHTVLTQDLPGHGADPTPPERISLQSYTDSMGSLLAAIPEPAMLVGHSFGGVVVSQTAELYPEAVASSVYVSGFLLRNGQSVWRHGFPSPRRATGNPPVLGPANLKVMEDKAVLDLDRSVVAEAFYSDCTPQDRRRAMKLWKPEPLVPLRTALALTDQNFGRVSRAYIQCLADRVIPPAAQRRMCRLTPCSRVIEMEAGHSPLLSAPAVLADHLHRLAHDLS